METTPELPVANILIVDDLPANLLTLNVVLEPLGHRVLSARSGKEALRLLLTVDFSLIIMDVDMPELDGIETVRLIKGSARHRHIPVLFVTAVYTDIEHKLRAYATGAVDYVVKPYDEVILRSKVAVLVDLSRQRELIKQQAELLQRHERQTMERRAEQRFRGLIDAMPLCVWEAGPDGQLRYANRAAEAYLGARDEGQIALSLMNGLHPGDRWRVLEAWTTALSTRQPVEIQARMRRRGQGAYRWHMARAVPQREEDGQFTGWLVTATDIDDQKHVEEAERQARLQAESANSSAMKNEFLTTLSHELRTPLTVIVWNADILKRGTLSPERAQQAIDRIVRNAAAQTRLIDNMLDASRIATGTVEMRLQRVDAVTVIRETIDALRPTAHLKHVTLSTELLPCKTLIMADPRRLRQITWEVVLNAIKFTPAGGRVDVQARHARAKLEITVTDTGEGIAESFLPRLFDGFTKANRATAHEREGLGVGLALVRKLVELHGGSIRAESAGMGRGATFTIELPHARRRSARPKPAKRISRRPAAAAQMRQQGSWPVASKRREVE
ncbi:MAG: ATP-binding protein [Minicystis sp.]